MSLAHDDQLGHLIALALREDLGDRGDITTQLLPNSQILAEFSLVLKQPAVFAGREITTAVLHAYDPSISVTWQPRGNDGEFIEDIPTELARIRGPIASVLAAERVLLNFVQRLCGIATATRRFVEAVAGTKAVITDTRKTTPGWRMLEKYAVRCGGGVNHRAGLHDAVLIKDNHLAGVEPRHVGAVVFDMLNRLSPRGISPAFVEVEAPSILFVEELLKVVGVDIVLLDNFTVPQLREAVALRDSFGLRGKVQLEASGGITLERVKAVAETGVERISVGAITHSAPACDLSLEPVAC